MKNKNDDLIIRCLADKFMPLALVFGIYVILHGHLSPGGGFQGGTLCASAVLLIYIGYGAERTCKTLHPTFLRQTEPVALIVYICIAIAGIAAGYNFCTNFYFDEGNIGALISSGTIANMDEAVGYNVTTGIGTLLILMIGLLIKESEVDEPSEGGVSE